MPFFCPPYRALQLKLLLAFVPVGVVITTVQAQTAQQVSPPSQTTPSNVNRPAQPGPLDLGPNPLQAMDATRMQHLREDDRRKRLLADTARLVALTNELQAEVEKSTRDELSLDVVRKASEIEKLAHDVRERMKN